jgi:hypothetical protein
MMMKSQWEALYDNVEMASGYAKGSSYQRRDHENMATHFSTANLPSWLLGPPLPSHSITTIFQSLAAQRFHTLSNSVCTDPVL